MTALETNYQLNVEQDNSAIYDLLIQKGDLLLSENEFDDAILIYQQALEIKPSDQAAIAKIDHVEAIKQELSAILEAESQLNSQFDALIHNGDVFLSANQVDDPWDTLAIFSFERIGLCPIQNIECFAVPEQVYSCRGWSI